MLINRFVKGIQIVKPICSANMLATVVTEHIAEGKAGLGETLKKFRHEKGLTQREVASKAGVSSAYLAQIETGEKRPGLETLETLCAALGVQKAEERKLKALYDEDQSERREDKAKNREMAKQAIRTKVLPPGSHEGEVVLREGNADLRQIPLEPIAMSVTRHVSDSESREKFARGHYYIAEDVHQIRENLKGVRELITEGRSEKAAETRFPSVCLLGLGRCGTNIALGVSILAYEAKKAFLAAAKKERTEKDRTESDVTKKRLDWHSPNWMYEWFRRAFLGAVPVYWVEPIVLVGDLDVDIRGRIDASEYKELDAHYKKLKMLDLAEVHHGGAGNVPIIGQYIAKIILNRDSSSFKNDANWKYYHSYLVDSVGLQENESRVFFYIFSAGGGTGSGMSGEFGLAQQYSYHRRIHAEPSQIQGGVTDGEKESYSLEPIFSAGMTILPHFDPAGGERTQAIHVNAGRLICKYLSEEWRFSKSNFKRDGNGRLERILRPWNTLMLISNNVMRYVEQSAEGQKADVTQMEKHANQYVAQQIFNILTAQALTTDYDENYFKSAGLNIGDTMRLDSNDLYMSLTGPVAIAYAQSPVSPKNGNGFDIEDVLFRSIALPCLNKQTQALEGISILPQDREQYAETLNRFNGNGEKNYSALQSVKCFLSCSSTVTIISIPKGFKLRSRELSALKLALDNIFPHTKVKRYALVIGASPYLSLTTLIARSACLSDEVLTLLFAYIKRSFAKEAHKYSNHVEEAIKSYLIEPELDESGLIEILMDSEDPSEIMLANWQEVRATYERKYRDFLVDPAQFVPMDDLRLKIADVINALKYIAAALRHRSIPLAPPNLTSWTIK